MNIKRKFVFPTILSLALSTISATGAAGTSVASGATAAATGTGKQTAPQIQQILKQDPAKVQGQALIKKIEECYPNTDGEVEEYLQKYPESPVADLVRFKYALYKFSQEDYSAACAAFEETDSRSLTRSQKDEYMFKKGYCQFRSGDSHNAKRTFDKITGGKYHGHALYYLGYIKYMENDFASAIPLFEAAQSEPQFADACSYHILESKYMLKDHNYVIQNGTEIYSRLDGEYKSRAARILSESYYATENPQKAKYYYELYSTNSDNISGKDKFYAGMIAYTLKSYAEAADAFSQVANATDSLGQSASYHLGQCYIQLKNKHKAQEAFKAASSASYDRSIQEDAFFNYAKLTFDLNRNIAPFNEYLATWPTSNAKWDEMHSYMGTAFLLEKEYDNAIAALKKIKTPDKGTTGNLQKAELLRGLELAHSNSYTKASQYFRNAAGYTSQTGNTSIGNLAAFWLAECQYRKNNFAQSLSTLQKLTANRQFTKTAEYPVAIYNIGYNQFKLGNYEAAIESFATYLTMPEGKNGHANEARLRLADSYFMNRNYQQAAEQYNIIAQLESNRNLYAPLQASIAYGLLSDDQGKIKLLTQITSPENSRKPLYTQALYELGRTYVQNGKDNDALQVMERLINNPPDSLYYHKALLETGMINANRKNWTQALAAYKKIIEDKAINEETQSALAGIENIYQQQNKMEEYFAYLDNIGMSESKSASERETMLFNSAEQVFLSGNWTAALNSLNSFIDKYPDGAKTSHAKFYIAESFNRLGKAEAAAAAYMDVMMHGNQEAFAEIATLNYAKLSYQLQRYDEAARAYETLEQIARLGNNRTEGTTGKMRSLFHMQDYRSALAASNQVLALELKDSAINREALYIKAKSYLAEGSRKNGNEVLGILAKDPQDRYGAEAAYLLILDAYDAGEFSKVEELAFALSDSQTEQTYWLAKSFITLGDSYAERDETEQAKATFESIKENYVPSGSNDDILPQVEMRLGRLAAAKSGE